MDLIATADTTITLDSIIRRSRSFFTTDIGGELVMMSVENGGYFSLNPTGSEIWMRSELPIRVSDLCADLVMDFEVDSDVCRDEVMDFLVEMSSKGLIEIVDAD
jgi:hypothetical protein